MINWEHFKIQRLIVHEIEPKGELMEHASIDPTNNIIDVSAEISDIITKRLKAATRNEHRAFQLQIEDTSANSFFTLCQDLKSLNDADFIDSSVRLAERLAVAQKSSSIPGGYFMLIQANLTESDRQMAIVIKAEPHAALKHSLKDGRSTIELMHSVFLSPSQKLFKVGILIEHDEITGDEINDIYGCLLYDAQFRPEQNPATYFYQEFLGLTEKENAKIQSKRFYEKTHDFISGIDEVEFDHGGANEALRYELAKNPETHISPLEFANEQFQHDEIRNRYIAQIVDFMPETFEKDVSLLNAQLKTRKIAFNNKIKIVGPEESFNRNVEIIEANSEYTLVKIKGRAIS